MTTQTQTHPVTDGIFRAVYDSPAALPGRYNWLTREADVRQIEKLLGMPAETIGAPLWVSGDRKRCAKCPNWAYAKPALLKVLEPKRAANVT
jgi:hypothetical protein